MRVSGFAQKTLLSYLSSLCERDILVCELCSQTSAICSLRERDIVSYCETAICSPLANVVESTLFINPHAAQFAAYRAAGISLAIRQISQIREDLYRFSLSASPDKLNLLFYS